MNPDTIVSDEFLGMFLVIYMAVILVSVLVGIAMYVLRSLSLYTIAKRRGLNHPWLAWIPVGTEWIIGSVSDQYKYVTQGKQQSRRKVLLVLTIAGMVLGVYAAGITVSRVLDLVFRLDVMGNGHISDEMALRMVMAMLSGLGGGLAAGILGIVAYVFREMCVYDLFKSCDPKNVVLFLVLSIFFGFTEPFFLLACRNKDLGMPPRKPVVDAPNPEL